MVDDTAAEALRLCRNAAFGVCKNFANSRRLLGSGAWPFAFGGVICRLNYDKQ